MLTSMLQMSKRVRFTRVVGAGFILIFMMMLWQVCWNSPCTCITKNSNFQRNEQYRYSSGIVLKLRERNAKLLMVVAYFRGGSSFTAEIFNHYSGSFFIFEPLYYFWNLNMTYVTNLNLTKRYFNSTEERITESLREIQNWFDCNVEDICLEALTTKDFISRGLSSQSYVECTGVNKTIDMVRKCIHHLKESCESSTLRVIKTIRLSVKDLQSMLLENPTLQLIHLVRDPRGILHSRKSISIDVSKFTTMSKEATKLCLQMENDLNATNTIDLHFPNRVRLVRYESVAMNPISKARRLYEYIGVTPSFEDLAPFYCKSFSKTNNETMFGTARVNSSIVSYRWFETARKTNVRRIDKVCGDVYKKLGYFSIDSEQYLSNGSLFDRHA